MRIENLCFSFGKYKILNGINLSVQNGEFVGILGPNGCGKSTLLKNILRIYRPNLGEIYLDDRNLNKFSLKNLARIIGFVPQKSELKMPLSVEEVVLMGRYSHLKSAFSGYEKADFKAVDEILQRLNLCEFRHRNVFSLSGGEFQRIMLARALVGNPKILLLDEPTSALDLNFGVSMLKICKNLVKEREIIGVIVIHDLNLAAQICDKIFMIKNGQIAYEGAPKELYTKEILNEIYDLECEILDFQNRPVVVTK